MEKEPIYIIPIVLTCIAIEIIIDFRGQRKLYNVKDSLTSFCISLMSIGTTLLCRGLSLSFLYSISRFSFTKLGFHWYEWLTAFLISDFLGYLFHWLGHKSRLFWIAHSPHHSSEYYNFTTAIRTPVFNAFFRFLFWSPLSLMGYPPVMIITIESLLFFYQFFLHTEVIKKLGWLEYIFNTPSHHRVHHGINDKYLDKNFGCVLIIWDRLCGTFQPEIEKPVYGIVRRRAGYNPLKIVGTDFLSLFRDLMDTKSMRDFFYTLFASPESTYDIGHGQKSFFKLVMISSLLFVIASVAIVFIRVIQDQ